MKNVSFLKTKVRCTAETKTYFAFLPDRGRELSPGDEVEWFGDIADLFRQKSNDMFERHMADFERALVDGLLTVVSSPGGPVGGDQPTSSFLLGVNATGTLTATRIDNGPTITSNSGAAAVALNYAENATSAVATVQATAVAGSGPIAYEIDTTSPDAADFAVHPTTGALIFQTPPNFEAPIDEGANNVYVVTVKAIDTKNKLFDTVTFTITVTDVGGA